MSENWKNTEKIATLFEKSLNPDNRVEHDVNLPVIGSENGLFRQCDVVIWKGKKPRQSLTIVEVQDRGDKVDRNTFGGWLDKMEDVGATELYCVSRKGFPKSIHEKAKKLGSKVQLMVLEEIPQEQLPINLIGISAQQTNIHTPKIGINLKTNIEGFELIKGVWSKFDKNIHTLRNEKIFQEKGDDTFKNLYYILTNYMNLNLSNYQLEKNYEVIIDDIRLCYEEEWFNISVTYNFYTSLEEHQLNINCTTYSQQEYGGLAWMIDASTKIDGKDVSGKIPIVKNEEGQFCIDLGNSELSDWVVSTHINLFSLKNSKGNKV